MRTLHITRPANANLQHAINTSIIFNYIRDHAGCYRALVSRDLHLSAPAVSRAVEKLIRGGWVVETERTSTANGKKAARLAVNTGFGLVIGIDLIKERIRLAVSDFQGKVQGTYQGFRLAEKIDLEASIAGEVDRILDSLGEPRGTVPRQVKAVCLGIPAVIDNETGEVVSASLYQNLEGLNLKTALSRRYGIPVFVENIVRLSALAEKNHGAARTAATMVFVEISNGIGAGIIIDHHIHYGANGSAGEIGFFLAGAESLSRRVGNLGSLEASASLEGIRRAAVEAVRRGEAPAILELAGGEAMVSAATVCQAAVAGDPDARRILADVVDRLAIALVNLTLVLNPELIVIGGDLCTLPGVEPLLIEPMRVILGREIPFTVPRLCLSALGEDAGIIGASDFAIESLLLRSFPYKIERNG